MSNYAHSFVGLKAPNPRNWENIMTWNTTKQARRNNLRMVTTPLTLAEIWLYEEKVELMKKGRTPEIEERIDAITALLPQMCELRYHVMRTPEKRDVKLNELRALDYEYDCHRASLANQAVLRDPKFLAACERAGVQPTRRQASKYRIGRRGAALKGKR